MKSRTLPPSASLLAIAALFTFLLAGNQVAAADTWTVYTTANSGLPNNRVHAVAIDQNGLQWFGTEGDAASFDGNMWTVYNPSVRDTHVIAVDPQNVKWFGAGASGVARFDGTNWTFYNTSNSGLPENYVRSIGIDRDGSIWFGTGDCCTYRNGVAHFDGSQWETYTPSNSGLPNYTVLSIAIDPNGVKWFATYAGGVVRFDDTMWTVYNTSNSPLPHNEVYAAAIDLDGSVWFGTGNGLARFDGTNWTVYTAANSVLTAGVNSIAIDSSGTKWIGSAIGLVRFDGTTWTVYNPSNSGLPSDFIIVARIAMGADGKILIGTMGGAALFETGTPLRSENEYKLPYPPGLTVYTTQGNDETGKGFSHHGKDSKAFDFANGTQFPVLAARSGRVFDFREDQTEGCGTKDCSNYIVIVHEPDDGTADLYLHLKQDSVIPQIGDWVVRGCQIAAADNTGRSTGNHLHFAKEKMPKDQGWPHVLTGSVLITSGITGLGFEDVTGGIPQHTDPKSAYPSGNVPALSCP